MKNFMDEDFLLSNDTAKLLYHSYAKKMPVIDYHCHIDPEEIAKDRRFDNITQVWLGADHYKWRLMRSNGIEEKYITGDASDKEKFGKWADTIGRAIGNPLYHWSHLELKRYFGYDGDLNSETAEEVWNLCNEKLKSPSMSARNIMRMSDVSLIGTTDDPVDDLKWHKIIADDEEFDIQVLPMWRPDKATGIENPGFCEYINRLSDVSGIKINTFSDWKQAMTVRLDYFSARGCLGSDHGMKYVPFTRADEKTVSEILDKALNGGSISETEEDMFKTECMLFLASEYAKRNWVMQLHFGVTRDNNTKMYNRIGADTGFDGIYNSVPIDKLSSFLDELNKNDNLPKTILYSLNPNDNAAIGVLIGCFQEAGARGKIQQGTAWWFNDHLNGMTEQMTSLANLGMLANFVGMLTDSRSFLSYTRHEYFRRILCNIIGTKVENGEFPFDEKRLGGIIQDISFNNARDYFGFNIK